MKNSKHYFALACSVLILLALTTTPGEAVQDQGMIIGNSSFGDIGTSTGNTLQDMWAQTSTVGITGTLTRVDNATGCNFEQWKLAQ